MDQDSAGAMLPCLMADLADELASAAAVARAAATSALAEATRTAIRLDVALGEARTLHAALCLIARRARLRDD